MEKLIEKWKHAAHTYEVAEKNGKREATRLIGRYKKEAILHCIDELERALADSSDERAALPLHGVNGSAWTNDKVIDFVNWFLQVHELDFRYTLENQSIINSFENGDSPEIWHCR